MQKLTMKQLPKEDRPYEKCLESGAVSLTDAELLAVIIRTGSREETSLELARQILSLEGQENRLLGLLHHSLEDYCRIKGVGKVKGAQLMCIGELSRRIWNCKARETPVSFTHPEQIADYYMEDMRHLEQEEIRVMFLNTKQNLIRDLLVSKGTVNASVVTPREILIEGLRCLAVSMILVHNHPSGDPSPSESDILLTRRVQEAGNVIGISLLDHIIIGDKPFVSSRSFSYTCKGKQISMESNRSKYILAGLTAFCILLIGITSLKDGIMEPLRTGVGYFLIPIQSGVNKVGTGLYNELTDYGKLKAALAENENLKTQVAQLTEDNNRLQAEQFELNRLRQLYKLDQEYMQYNKIGARVIARDSEKWFQVFRINKGSSDGVAVDMNVVADGGLVGIVTDVGANYATVRSIIDDSSRVGAMSLDSSYNCIVAGDLTLYEQGRLKLTDFSRDAVLRNGDQIITSNISTKYLPGILIGYAVDVSIDPDHLTQSGYLIPAADFDNLQEVLILTDLKNSDEAVE